MSGKNIYLHHIGIMAPLEVIEDVCRFYVDIVGFVEGYRPSASLPGYWLYSGETPMIHLTAKEDKEPGETGYFHHVAIRCENMEHYISKLEEANIPYKRVDVSAVGQVQLVVKDPAGTKVELNFSTDE